MSTTAVGIVLGLVGSIAINVGNNLQSRGMYELEHHNRSSNIKDRQSSLWDGIQEDACQSTKWVVGTFVFITGALVNFASYGFAPQSTLATLESIQFVSNLFLGKILQEKKIERRMYFGTFVTVVGTILAVSCSSKKGAKIEVISDLVRLWENGLWISYLVFISLLTVALYLANHYLEKQRKQSSRNTMSVIYAVISALYGTLSVVFAKLLAELLDLQSKGVSIFTHWFTWITLICWLALMSFWLLRLNNALKLYSPLIIIPLLQVNFIFFAIMSGGIYFKEFNHMDAGQFAGFTISILLMFSGIYLMMPPADDDRNVPVVHRKTTIKPRQRQFSEILMSSVARTNHNDYNRRLSKFDSEVLSTLTPYDGPIPSEKENREVKEPAILVLTKDKRPSVQHQASVKRIRFKINESPKLAGTPEEIIGLSLNDDRDFQKGLC